MLNYKIAKVAKTAKVAKVAPTAKVDYGKIAKMTGAKPPTPGGAKPTKVPGPGQELNKAGRVIDSQTKQFAKPTGAPTTAPGAPTKAPGIVSKGIDSATKMVKGNLDKVKNITKMGGRVLSKVAVPLTVALAAFDVYSTETDETLDRTEKNIAHTKTAGGTGGAIAGAAAGAALGSVVPIVGTILGGIIGGGLG